MVPSTANFAKQKISIPQVSVKEEGKIFVYLSYEDQSNNFVYFDDFKVTYTPTNILQYNEYYSHGAPNARSWTRDNTTTNNFLANGGTELNTTTALYDLEYRNYDPILGRMNGVDPMADKYGSLTPYNYSFNSPTMHNDVSGADPTDQTPYWIEESMQRNARRYKGEVIDTYNQFAGLIRTFGVSLSEQRMVGGYTGTGNNSPYLMPLGAELQAQHDLFEMTPWDFNNKYGLEVWEHGKDYDGQFHVEYYFVKPVKSDDFLNRALAQLNVGMADSPYPKVWYRTAHGKDFDIVWEHQITPLSDDGYSKKVSAVIIHYDIPSIERYGYQIREYRGLPTDPYEQRVFGDVEISDTYNDELARAINGHFGCNCFKDMVDKGIFDRLQFDVTRSR